MNNVEFLQNMIERTEKPLNRVWYNDVVKLATENKIDMFYQVNERGFLGSHAYILTTDNELLLMNHDINDVNTSYVIAECYRNFEQVRDNFIELFNDELY